jgi:hypothetical protein
MDTRIEVTAADIAAALEGAALAAQVVEEGARTVAEITVAMRGSVRTVRRALHQLNAEGRLEVVQVIRRGLDGRSARVPAYRIKPVS